MLKDKINTLLNILLPAIIGIELIILVIKMSPTSPAEIWENIKIVVTSSIIGCGFYCLCYLVI